MTEDRAKKPDAGSPLDDFEGQVRYLAENTDLSPRQARELVRRYGHDREKLLEIARTTKAEG